MLKVRCLEKIYDKSKRIIGYKIISDSGEVVDVKADKLKEAIQNHKLEVLNLQLTSDNRLIDRKCDKKFARNTILGKDFFAQLKEHPAMKETYNKSIQFRSVKDINKSVYKLRALGASFEKLNNSVILALYDKNIILVSQTKFVLVNEEDTFQSINIGKLSLANVDTSEIKDMRKLFSSISCRVLDLSNCDFSNVHIYDNLFWFSHIDKVILDNTKFGYVLSAKSMFSYAHMKDIDLSKFDFSKTEEAYDMFASCSMQTVKFKSDAFSNMKTAHYMFSGCNIRKLDLSNIHMPSSANVNKFFRNAHFGELIVGKDNHFISENDGLSCETPLHLRGVIRSKSLQFTGFNNVIAPEIIFDDVELKDSSIIVNSFSNLTTYILDLSGFKTEGLESVNKSFEKVKILEEDDADVLNITKQYNNKNVIIRLPNSIAKLVGEYRNTATKLTAICPIFFDEDIMSKRYGTQQTGYICVSDCGTVHKLKYADIREMHSSNKAIFKNLKITKSKIELTTNQNILLGSHAWLAILDFLMDTSGGYRTSDSVPEYEIFKAYSHRIKFKTIPNIKNIKDPRLYKVSSSRINYDLWVLFDYLDDVDADTRYSGIDNVTIISDKEIWFEGTPGILENQYGLGLSNSEIVSVDLSNINFSHCKSLTGLVYGSLYTSSYITFGSADLSGVTNLSKMVDLAIDKYNIGKYGAIIDFSKSDLSNVKLADIIEFSTYKIPLELDGLVEDRWIKYAPNVEFTEDTTIKEPKANTLTIIVGSKSKSIEAKFKKYKQLAIEKILSEMGKNT